MEGSDEPSGDLITVRAFGSLPEALQAESLLRSESILCFLKNENILRIDPLVWMNRLGGLCLMVAESDVERALAILNARVSDEDLSAQAETAKPNNATE